MNKKKLIQKLQQIIDKLQKSKKKDEVSKNLLELKLSEDNKLFLQLKDKYDGFHN